MLVILHLIRIYFIIYFPINFRKYIYFTKYKKIKNALECFMYI